jgi:hypothetical protein
MFDDFPEFVRRFGNLWVICGPFRGGITCYRRKGDVWEMIDIHYNPPHSQLAAGLALKTGVSDSWELSTYMGVEQERKIRGNCLMILGLCFQKVLPASREAVFRLWKTAYKKAVA